MCWNLRCQEYYAIYLQIYLLVNSTDDLRTVIMCINFRIYQSLRVLLESLEIFCLDPTNSWIF